MANNAKLRMEVLDFVEKARAAPAEAVGSALDRLKDAAKEATSVDSVAIVGRRSNITWLSRTTLQPTITDTTQEPIDIPYPCLITGVLPTILLVDSTQGIIPPPPEAIDVFIQVDRKDTYTARGDRVTSSAIDTQVVNLPAFYPATSLRILEIDLSQAKNLLSVRFRWAVDLATVAAMKWGAVQLSMNWFILRLEGGP